MHKIRIGVYMYSKLIAKLPTFSKRCTWHLSDIGKIAHPTGIEDAFASSTLLQLAKLAISNLNLVTVCNVLSSEQLIYVSVFELLGTL